MIQSSAGHEHGFGNEVMLGDGVTTVLLIAIAAIFAYVLVSETRYWIKQFREWWQLRDMYREGRRTGREIAKEMRQYHKHERAMRKWRREDERQMRKRLRAQNRAAREQNRKMRKRNRKVRSGS